MININYQFHECMMLEEYLYFSLITIYNSNYKFYFVVSTPGVEPLDPFDDTYFNQDDMLTLKEEFRAQLFLANQLSIHTPKHICNI